MRILKIALVLCLVACLSSFSYKIKKASSNARKPVNRDIIAELTKHQWSVAEYTETINDTSNNTTLMLMPCEKDNFLKFNPDNTYQIFEGSSKCNTADQDIKAQGTWEYSEADNVIVERFSGGRGIEKKILELNEGLLKIQFELEAKKIVTITYLSELGKKDETKKDQFVDNSDPCSYILQLIRENLIEQGKFSLVGLKNFKDGVAPAHPGSSKRIVVYPFSDLSKGNEEVDPGATKDL
jgi:hypothetical protein